MIAVVRRFGNKRPCLTIETGSPVKARKSPVFRRYSVQVTVSQPYPSAPWPQRPEAPGARGAAIATMATSASMPHVLHGAHVVLGIGRARAVAVQIHLLEEKLKLWLYFLVV